MTQQAPARIDNLERAVAYRCLSRLFAVELDRSTLDSALHGDLRQVLDDLAGDPQMTEAVDLLKFNLDRLGDAPNGVMDLRAAFAALFLGAGGDKVAPPYASFYLTGRHCLHHDCVAEIGDTYRAQGIEPVSAFPEPADHLALMLGFLSEMAARDAEAAELADFIDAHLASWLTDFAGDCCAHDPSGVYAAAALLLRAYIERDLRSLH